ncbi:MAG: MoaD/ThiS family protein [Actinobacteria bacterium]|nr:MoaD/ThiS family protein [Actinomycetota bacterium]
MPRLRLFAQAREVAGTAKAEMAGSTVADVLDEAVALWGPGFREVLSTCAVWVNGEPADRVTRLAPDDEVAVLPPVSGG